MDADRFAAYWGNNTPRMHIPGFTHPVQDYFLEDVLSLTDYIPPKNGKKKKSYRGKWNGGARKKNAWADSEHSDDETDTNVEVKKESNKSSQDKPPVPSLPIEERLKRVNESDIDYDMLAVLVGRLIERKKQNDDGSILVFLPGAPEIARAQESILKITRGENMTVLPLHGGLQPRDQQRVFHSARRGVTKVILSTNVAETSITIPDCTMVVDTCKEKQSSYDPSNRMPMLVERFASRDSLKQRRGRAGRVRPGSCYKLISRSTFGKLPEHGEPEIKRCALDQTLLTLLYLGVEEGSGNFLSSMLDPPSQKSIDAAIYSLEKLGAVLRSTFQDRNILKLSPLGIHLAGIPAPPTVGKCKSLMIIFLHEQLLYSQPFLFLSISYGQFAWM
jgi:ATP-dependent RNA helicase DHX57